MINEKNRIIQKCKGSGGGAQLQGACHRHEDRSLSPVNPHNKQSVEVRAWKRSARRRSQETERLGVGPCSLA